MSMTLSSGGRICAKVDFKSTWPLRQPCRLSCSGFEAWYSHYKSNFRYKAQWTPVVIAPLLVAASVGAVRNQRVAQTWLPALSTVAMLDGAVGFGYHARGVLRRPGGLKMPVYNIIHGPPIFAPLLFAAAGFIGLLASLLRREKR